MAKRVAARGTEKLIEWVGARRALPVYVTEPAPARPEMALWVEAGSGRVIGHGLDAGNGASPLLAALREALEAGAGRQRAPARLRVADEGEASELRVAFRGRFEIVVGPTPEADEAFAAFLSAMSAEDADASYFDDGRVSERAVASLFRAAARLYRAAPWRRAADADVLRLDIPALGVDAACVSILGALGEALGLVVFPSLLAWERFLDAAENFALDAKRQSGPRDFGTDVLALDFWPAHGLPERMHREALEHGWPVVSPDAYPTVVHRDRDGVARPLAQRDVQIAAACASAVASFVERHPHAFTERDGAAGVAERFVTEDGVEVRLTLPFDGEMPAAAPTGKVGRNDPCPCGSGKKFKKCCAGADGADRAMERRRAAVHEQDEQLVAAMMRFANDRLGPRWHDEAERALDVLGDIPAIVQLVGPWSVYGAEIEGRPVVDCFLEERAKHLTTEQRAWLEAQQRARLGVWEIVACEPGVGLTVRDLLHDGAGESVGGGPTRRVREVRGSRTLVVRDVVLGRIVDHDGASYFCGIHPRILSPRPGGRLAETWRRRLTRPARGSTSPRRRDAASELAMMRDWTRAVIADDAERSAPRTLVNTDGDELLLTADHFELDAKDRAAVAAALSTLEGADAPGEDDRDEPYVFVREGNAVHTSWDNTVIGKAFLRATSLVVETNSVPRADALRRRIEERCGPLLRHRVREHSDLQSSAARASKPPSLPPPPPDALHVLQELKSKFYQQWVDDRIPALGGKTPRQAVRTKTGRRQVDLLLRELENHEQRSAEGPPFDFGPLRAKLALDGPAVG